MKPKRNGSAGAATTSDTASPESVAALPAWKAFVVQFSRETESRGLVFSGRVEHLNSGHRLRFASEEELISVLRKMLGELGEKGKSEG
jgi:hypothetical protein